MGYVCAFNMMLTINTELTTVYKSVTISNTAWLKKSSSLSSKMISKVTGKTLENIKNPYKSILRQ